MNTPPPALSASSLPVPELFSPELSNLDLPPVRTSGFTLTRLLVVIAVAGTLSALATPTLFPAQP